MLFLFVLNVSMVQIFPAKISFVSKTKVSWLSSKSSSAFFLNPTTISTSYTIPSGNNAMTAGPITVADGVSIVVPDGSSWTIV